MQADRPTTPGGSGQDPPVAPTLDVDPAPELLHLSGLTELLAQTEALATNRHAPKELPALPFVVGQYELDREIARGGMGVILRGRDTRFGRDIVMKLLMDASRPDRVRRFVGEARITGQMQHPGVVPIYDLGELPDGRPYFTMRLVSGQTFAKALNDRPNADHDRPQFLNTFIKVCQTLAYAHAHGILHRDLKPANILVAPFGVVKVMDWGLAKFLGRAESMGEAGEDPISLDALPDDESNPHTLNGSVMGTPAYMPPEQAAGLTDLLDERCDVFGLGAILCEILTGKPPYTETDGPKALRRAAKGDLDEAFNQLSRCSADSELVSLSKRCLAANPNERPRNAGVLAAELTRYQEAVQRQAERDLVRFFELSLDLFCIADFDGFFHRVNSNFSRLLGFPTQDFLTRPFLDFVHAEDIEGTQSAMSQLTRGQPVVQFRNRYRDVHNTYHWLEWTAKSIPEEGVIFAVARDITERVAHQADGIGPAS